MAKQLYGFAVLLSAPNGVPLVGFGVVGLFCSTCVLTLVRKDVEIHQYMGDEATCDSCGKAVIGFKRDQ